LTRDASAMDLDINLASILNILWRRRLIVLGLPALGLLVGVLYGIFGTRRWEATATIRPGITAFAPDGGPVRHWQLKDITRWYDQQLYRRGLVERLGLARGARPVIRAEFIAQGLQNLQGGDVITLWTTGTSPELAAAILDSSIVLFEEYSEADTVSSQLKLTRDGLLLEIDGLQARLEAVDRDEAALALKLDKARADSALVVAEDLGMVLRMDALDRHVEYCERRLVDLRDEEPRLVRDLDQVDLAMRRLAAQGAAGSGETVDVPDWVRRDAVLDGGDVLEALTRAKLEVQHAVARNRALQDSLTFVAETKRLDRARLEIDRETTIRARIRESESTIGDLLLQRQYDLPHKRRDLRTKIHDREVRVTTLSPLQRVGTTVVSDKPVRPRTVRAVAILVVLGAMAGLVLGFAWDYVSGHRDEIFRD
jgi:hypothetical protein